MERKTKPKELGKPKVKREKDVPPTKVVIRRLPPTWTKEVCLEQISPLPDHDFFYFSKADTSLGQFSFSRAYINFLNQADILNFRDKFDGYVFVDAQGNEYVAVVELAVFQKIPRKKAKRIDPKKASIEEDPDYVKFLAALEKEKEDSTGQVNVESLLEEIEAKQGKAKDVQSTPLIEYLKKKKEDKMHIQMYYSKQRDERKRKEVERRRQRDDERRRRRERDQKEKEKRDRDRLAKKKKEKELAGREKDDGSEHPLKKSPGKDSARNLGELTEGVEGLKIKERSPSAETEESKPTSPSKARTEDSKRDWREEKEDRRERRDRDREPPRFKKDDVRPKDRGPRDRDRDRPPRSARDYDKGPKEKAKPSSYSARRDKEKESRRDREREKRDAGRSKKQEPEEATFSLAPSPAVSSPTKSYGEESRASSRVGSDGSRSTGDTAPGPADLGSGDRAAGASGTDADKDDKRKKRERPERAIYIPRRARERLEQSGADKS